MRGVKLASHVIVALHLAPDLTIEEKRAGERAGTDAEGQKILAVDPERLGERKAFSGGEPLVLAG